MATFSHRAPEARTPAEFLKKKGNGYYSVEEIAVGCGQSEVQVLTALRNQRSAEQRTYDGKIQFRRKAQGPTGGGRKPSLTAQQLAAARMRLLSGEKLPEIARDIWQQTRCSSVESCYQALWRALGSQGADNA